MCAPRLLVSQEDDTFNDFTLPEELLAATESGKLRRHPDSVVEPASLAAVPAPSVKYRFAIPYEHLFNNLSDIQARCSHHVGQSKLTGDKKERGPPVLRSAEPHAVAPEQRCLAPKECQEAGAVCRA